MDICNVTKLTCTKCNPVCEHRVELEKCKECIVKTCYGKEIVCAVCRDNERRMKKIETVEYDNFKKQWDEWHKNNPSCTFVLPIEKPIDLVSETIALEDWWWELCKKEDFTKKDFYKMWAIEKVINKMWRRHSEYECR